MERLRQAIVERLEEMNISIRAVAKTCGISEGSVRNILKGRVQNPRIDTLEKICRACGTSVDGILESQHRAAVVTQPCVTSYAKSPTEPAKYKIDPADSQNVYKPGYTDPHIFEDENGDEALLMCHALVNTGMEYTRVYRRDKLKGEKK